MSNLDRVMNVVIVVVAAAAAAADDDEAQNGVRLSTNLPPDEHGPVTAVEMRHRSRLARTFSNREFLAGQAVQLLREAGATRVHRFSLAPVLLHMHSSMRMGLGETDSVLDESAEARAVPRLLVAENDALANGIGGPNPTLTTQAVATRTVERTFQRYLGGDSWVLS